jgi:peptide-methionine (R)-S-oxide reductase
MALSAVLLLTAGCGSGRNGKDALAVAEMERGDTVEVHMSDKVSYTEQEWQQLLTPQEYNILRERDTEPAFSGKFYQHKEPGTYVCAGCGNPLFSSDNKFESGCGWPSYFQPIEGGRVETEVDSSYGMVRTEIVCNRCDSHLGHVFDDGPKPTGLRYCVNSASMKFIPKKPD